MGLNTLRRFRQGFHTSLFVDVSLFCFIKFIGLKCVSSPSFIISFNILLFLLFNISLMVFFFFIFSRCFDSRLKNIFYFICFNCKEIDLVLYFLSPTSFYRLILGRSK